MPNGCASSQRHRQRGDRDVGVALGWKLDHLRARPCGRCGRRRRPRRCRARGLDQVDVLVHRVGRALEPLRAVAHLRRHDGDEVLRHERRERPAVADVLDQRLRLVLHQQVDRVDPRVDQVGQHEVHDAVLPLKGTAGLQRSAVSGIRREPSPPAITIATIFACVLLAASRRCLTRGLRTPLARAVSPRAPCAAASISR